MLNMGGHSPKNLIDSNKWAYPLYGIPAILYKGTWDPFLHGIRSRSYQYGIIWWRLNGLICVFVDGLIFCFSCLNMALELREAIIDLQEQITVTKEQLNVDSEELKMMIRYKWLTINSNNVVYLHWERFLVSFSYFWMLLFQEAR